MPNASGNVATPPFEIYADFTGCFRIFYLHTFHASTATAAGCDGEQLCIYLLYSRLFSLVATGNLFSSAFAQRPWDSPKGESSFYEKPNTFSNKNSDSEYGGVRARETERGARQLLKCILSLFIQQIRSFTNNLWCIFVIRYPCFVFVGSRFFVLFFGRLAQTVVLMPGHLQYSTMVSMPPGSVLVCSSVRQCRHLSETERYPLHRISFPIIGLRTYGICSSGVAPTAWIFLSPPPPTPMQPKCAVLLMNPCFVSRLLLFFLSFILSFHYLFRIGICIRSDAVNKRVSFNLNVIWFYFFA